MGMEATIYFMVFSRHPSGRIREGMTEVGKSVTAVEI
jgi:hypothetical protein